MQYVVMYFSFLYQPATKFAGSFLLQCMHAMVWGARNTAYSPIFTTTLSCTQVDDIIVAKYRNFELIMASGYTSASPRLHYVLFEQVPNAWAYLVGGIKK